MAEGYKDFTAGMTLTAGDLEDYCEKQGIMRFASAAARNAALASVLTEGLLAYLQDVNAVTMYSGSAWSTLMHGHGTLPTWTPTVTQSVGVSVTITYARYQRNGRLVTGWFNLAVTSSGTASNVILISTPVTAALANQPVGSGDFFDASAASSYAAVLETDSTTTFSLRVSFGADNRLGATGSAFTGAIVSGDVVRGQFCFEAAADA